MPDPNAQQEFLVRVKALTEENMKFIRSGIAAGIDTGDRLMSSKQLEAKDLLKYLLLQVVPTIMHHFTYLHEDEPVLIDAGLFNQGQEHRDLESISEEEAESILNKMLEEIKS